MITTAWICLLSPLAAAVLIKRLTLIVRDQRIEQVFYPVFPPDRSADQVVSWLRRRPI